MELNESKEDEMGRICSMRGEKRKKLGHVNGRHLLRE
jgi:hypothetical protein